MITHANLIAYYIITSKRPSEKSSLVLYDFDDDFDNNNDFDLDDNFDLENNEQNCRD